MPLPEQPTLPVEDVFSDAELDFMENSPPGLYAENQNSNIGLFRKLWTDRVQELIDQQTTIYNERFVTTSAEFLDEHERELGLPLAPANRDVSQRRQDVTTRRMRGAFTRSRRAAVVEHFLVATFGNPIQFTPIGVELVAGGVPLYAEAVSDFTLLYRIVEDIPGFHYQVRIKNTVTPDGVGLDRELDRITPSGMTYDVVSVAIP